jgi:hypothetical protein
VPTPRLAAWSDGDSISLSFQELEARLGFSILVPDSSWRRKGLFRRVSSERGVPVYYEAYDRNDSSGLVGLTQSPRIAPAPELSEWREEWLNGISVRFQTSQLGIEARFITGAVDAVGREIEAVVSAPSEQLIRDFISSLDLSQHLSKQSSE